MSKKLKIHDGNTPGKTFEVKLEYPKPKVAIMIEKLPEIQIHSCARINEKLNEVIDWVNDVSALRVTDKQVTANLPNIDAGELAFLSKENSDLKDELERICKALDVAVDALKTVRRYTAINQFAPKSREAHIVAKKAVAEITALEQKDK